MKFKLLLKEGVEGIPQEKWDFLPSGFHRIGDILIIRLHKELEEYQKEIGEFLIKRFRVKSVFVKGPVQGELRKPMMRKIAGRTNTTLHRENNCLFKIDVSRLLFAKGNVYERGRIEASEGEEVVDLFAGIGYFSIPLAKKNPSCSIVAIEKNPVAVKFLRENLELNRIENVEVIEDDCRNVKGVKGDRVIMGYLPGTEEFLPTAFSFLRRSGIIHFHNVYRKGELWRKPLGTLETQALEHGYLLVGVLYKKIVKQYSPCKYHVVVDAKFRIQ